MIGIIVGAGVALASSLTTLLVGHVLDRRRVSAAWLKEQRLAAWVALMDASKGLMKIAADMYEMGSYAEMRPLLSGVRECEGELSGAVVRLDVVGPPEIEDLLADFYDAHRPLGEMVGHEAAWRATTHRHRQFNDTPQARMLGQAEEKLRQAFKKHIRR